MDYKKIVIFIVVAIYFSISWFFPWDNYEVHESISTSYFFDIVFIAITGVILKEKIDFKILEPLKLLIKTLLTSIIAVVVILLTEKMNLLAPFRFIDQLAVQILILAPFVEEFIFRYGVFHLIKRTQINVKYQIVINAFLFSISHIQAIWILPQDFHGFIYYQVAYTFLLGWVCTKVMMVHKNIFAPIIIHFIFNLMFYIAVLNGNL